MTEMTEMIEKYYDDNIKTLFNGYVNEKHKKDCVDGILVLFDHLEKFNVTLKQWQDDVDVYDAMIDYLFKIPLYLEEITGDHSDEIVRERQDTLIKFLLTPLHNTTEPDEEKKTCPIKLPDFDGKTFLDSMKEKNVTPNVL
jgi:hypothetical protein